MLAFICSAESLVSEEKLKQTQWQVKGEGNSQFECFVSNIMLGVETVF
jgi:hypothetical protein